MEKHIKVRNKKFDTTNEPKVPYLSFKDNYCNLKVSTVEDYDIYFDKVYYRENNIIIVPKRDFIYQTNASTGEILSGLYRYSWRNFGSKNSGFNPNNYPECMVNEDTSKFLRDQGEHVIRGMYKLPQSYLDELTNIKPIGSADSAFSSFFCLTTLNGVEKTWDTSQITSMSLMFNYLGFYNPENSNTNSSSSRYPLGTLDISNWSFENCLDTHYLFYNTKLNIILPDEINTQKAIKMNEMFYGASNIQSNSLIINCNSIDISPDTNLKNSNHNGMFFMFKDSPITKVKLKNVKDSVKPLLTSRYLKGDDTLEIEFID